VRAIERDETIEVRANPEKGEKILETLVMLAALQLQLPFEPQLPYLE
jgi:hypothetical protein